jgi:hypothetical protein
MRWMMIALLVSLGVLLGAVAGVAHHILQQRGRLRSNSNSGPVPKPAAKAVLDRVEEIDQEVEL